VIASGKSVKLSEALRQPCNNLEKEFIPYTGKEQNFQRVQVESQKDSSLLPINQGVFYSQAIPPH